MCLSEEIKQRVFEAMHPRCTFCEQFIVPPNKQFNNGGHGYLVGAVILSVPITFVGIIWMSKWFSSLNQPPTTGEPETQNEIQQEDAERGTN